MTARDYIDLSVLQLDRLLEAAMPYALGVPRTERFVDPHTGDEIEETFEGFPNWQAARLAVDIIHARLKILGLDPPQKIHFDSTSGSASDLLAQKIAELRRNADEDPPDLGPAYEP